MLDLALNCLLIGMNGSVCTLHRRRGGRGELSDSCAENARKFSDDLPLPACDGIVIKLLESAV